MQIYAATGNAGKLRDFAAAAAAEGIAILPLPGLAAMPAPAEDAPDFAGNAALKAVAYSRLAPGELVLADDSGLLVDVLDGLPGVRSARFADDRDFLPGSGLSKDERNNRCLLALLEDVPAGERTGRFHCTLALARDGEVLLTAEGDVEGDLLFAGRGTGGFGYDCLFRVSGGDRTMAELTPGEKWGLGHRGQAFRSLLQTLGGVNRAAMDDIEQNRTK